MARRYVITAQCYRFAPEIAELELFVAHHAWIRRSSGLVLTREVIDHQSLELIGLVDHVMWNPQRMSNCSCIGYCLRTATFVLRARDAILWPDFHGHTNDVVALLTQ